MLSLRLLNPALLRRLSFSAATFSDAIVTPEEDKPSAYTIWKRRQQFSTPGIQRFEKPEPKIYYAPEWKHKDVIPFMDEQYNPRKNCLTTPEKWEYQNKVDWVRVNSSTSLGCLANQLCCPGDWTSKAGRDLPLRGVVSLFGSQDLACLLLRLAHEGWRSPAAVKI